MNEADRFYRPTWIEVDLGAIAYNYDLLREKTRPDAQILIPLKADAYGHGAVEVARLLETKEVAFFGVATIDEAVILRENGIRTPILILNAILEQEIDAVLAYDLTQTLCTEDVAKRLDAEALKRGQRIPVHVKIDTGMGRLGVWYEEAKEFIRFVKGCRHLFLEGLYTHFSDADGAQPEEAMRQLDRFQRMVHALKEEELLPPLVHMANSAGVLKFPDSHFNLVRPGLAVYGIHPFYQKGRKEVPHFRAALRLVSRIVYLKPTPKGRKISYGGTFTTQKETVIATLPVGYADGYNRLLSNRAELLVRGRRVPVAGRICMDQTMVDVGYCPGVSVGDEAVLIGRQGDEEIRVEELSTICNTIPYEFFTRLSHRIPRTYRNPSKGALPLSVAIDPSTSLRVSTRGGPASGGNPE